jgi:hypothetical protein
MKTWGIRNRYKNSELNKGGFGDKWAQVSASINYAKENNHSYVLFSEYGEKGELDKIEKLHPYNKEVIEHIFKQFNFEVRFVGSSRTSRRESVMYVKQEYPLVENKHNGKVNNRICYELDVEQIIAPHHKAKRFSDEEQEMFFKWSETKSNIDFVEIGRGLTLEEDIDILCSSDVFVGIDSGMSHVAHSIEIPMFLQLHRGKIYKNRQLECFHPNKKYTSTSDMKDMIGKLEMFLGQIK